NDSGLPVTSVLIRPISPTGVTITPNFFNLFQNPIADGSIHGPLTVDLNLLGSIFQATEICFEVVYLSGGEECCKFTHCMTILPQDPCENVSVRASAASDENGECCYTLELKNDYCPDYFTSVVTEIITPGVVFGSFSGGSTWTGAQSASMQMINWRPNNNTTIPLGSFGNIDFCLDKINSISQVPQEVVVHWMRGREIVCSDTLRFDCNPCAFIELDEGVCNDDGSVSFNFTIFNTSGRTVTEFYLEAQTPNIQFNPAYVTATIPDGGSYTGTFTVSPLDNTPLVPGTIVAFKATLFDGTDWCCHMEGLSLEIPPCDGCECGDQEEWRKLFDQGFQSKIDCEEGLIQFRTEMTECDSVFLQIFDATGLIASVSGLGNATLTIPILPNGNYIVSMTAIRYDENGEICFEAARRYDLSVDCPKDPCDCEDESFFDAVNAGPEFEVDCERGEIRVRTKLTECDIVTLRILGPNNQVLVEEKFEGDATLTFPILPNGTYTVEMEVFRLDADGNVCMESIFIGKLDVNCPDDDCCGTEDEFIADVSAGFDIDFNCNAANGAEMTVKPVQAKECDLIIWNIYTQEGELIYSDTTAGDEGFTIPVPDVSTFIVETRWERLNAAGESCYGVVVGRRDIRNECFQIGGVIDLNVTLRAPDEVAINWTVQPESTFDEFVIVRTDKQDDHVLAKVPAEIGKTQYYFNDKTAEEGENAYIVFGLIQNKEISKSIQDRVHIQIAEDLEVALSPNPTFGRVNLNVNQSGDYQVLVRDQNGRILHQQLTALNAGAAKQLDVSTFPDGVLFLQLVSDQGTIITKRLVKLH
ncbi:MAG: T9SS type A sorting domain-containing protein, partial [Bacteroidota bacterium]